MPDAQTLMPRPKEQPEEPPLECPEEFQPGIPEEDRPLSAQQAYFCLEYAEHFNGYRAALAAGYAERGARVSAVRLLTRANIRAEVQRCLEEKARRVKISGDRIVYEVAAVALADPAELYDVQPERVLEDGTVVPARETLRLLHRMPERVRRAIQSIKHDPKTGQPIEVKLHDKATAQDKLLRLLGLVTDKGVLEVRGAGPGGEHQVKHEHTGHVRSDLEPYADAIRDLMAGLLGGPPEDRGGVPADRAPEPLGGPETHGEAGPVPPVSEP